MTGEIYLASWNNSLVLGDATGYWDFSESLLDKTGKTGTVSATSAGTRTDGDGLRFESGQLAYTSSVDATVNLPATRTLAAVATMHDLSVTAGSLISVGSTSVLDAIVFAERESDKWMAGSDNFDRTADVGGTNELTGSPVFLAAVYDTISSQYTIQLYRNGAPYGSSYTTNHAGNAMAGLTNAAEDYFVAFGTRGFVAGNWQGSIDATIHRAGIWARALTATEIMNLYSPPLSKLVLKDCVLHALSTTSGSERLILNSVVNKILNINTTQKRFSKKNCTLCGITSCTSMPTICENHGYQNAICTIRHNPDTGVICAKSCAAGFQKAGIFNHTCKSCLSGKYSTSANAFSCTAWSNCIAGQKIAANGTATTDRTCVACPSGQFATASNQNTCTNWTNCSAGYRISANGTNNTDRVCTPCGAGAYSADANEGSCIAWTNCVAGQKIAANGTATTDRTCEACPTGKFSTASNQNTCTNWTACNATTEVESSAGSATADRVCAAAGSPSPSGDSPSPSDAAGSPSPSGDSPSPASNTSTTDVPNKLSTASSYRPQLYLCGVLMVSICFGL
jgi:hypothetical protein